MIADLVARRLLIVTGKGGVGKTTVAAALGLVAARGGRRTIVAEVARRSDVMSSLDRPGSAVFEEVEIEPGLWHISIDPQDALREYLRDQLPVGALAQVLAQSRMFGLLTAATPGLRELLTIGKVWELAQDLRRTAGARGYDLVICDAPATGHGVGLLAAPATFAGAAGTGPVARQAATINAMLTDPARTGVVAVTRAEELPVTETAELARALGERLGLRLDGVVANAIAADRFTAREAARLEPHATTPAVAVALRAHRRALAQRAQLRRLTRLTGLRPSRLALRPGGADLQAMADELSQGGR